MTLRLIGPHAYLTADLDATDKAWIAAAPVVKAIDDRAPLLLADPRAITVYRESNEDLGTMLVKLAGYRPTFVEGRNEYKAKMPDLLDHIQWMQIFVPACHTHGLKVAGFSIAVGNLDPEGVTALDEAGWAGIDATAYHAYWAMQGPVSDWTTFRYRRWYAQTGGNMPPVIITEAGRDTVEQEGGAGLPGWMTQGVSPEQYYAEWQEFDRQLQLDAQKFVTWQGRRWPLVLGATGFSLRGTAQWANYELAPLAAWFARDSVIGGTVPPAPPPSGGAPMWDRHAVYNDWQKSFGGQGYNPSDAFGQIISNNPDNEYGVFVGGYRVEDPFIYAYTTVGIFCYDKRSGAAVFATSEEELPLA